MKNPSSMQHLVYLHPGQYLTLILDCPKVKPTVELSGGLLDLAGSTREGDQYWFFIKPQDHAIPWAEYSSTFMGEVWIDGEDVLSRLIVIQSCTNKAKGDI